MKLRALAAASVLLLTACSFPGSAAPVLKIGVIAPFEGAGRHLGYAILPAVKAVAEDANGRRALDPYRLAVVAFNDNMDPATAADQARALAADRDVVAVVGPFDAATAASAGPVLAEAGVAARPVLSADALDEDTTAEVAEAKAAASALIDALAAEIQRSGRPPRAEPGEAHP
jgi:branched-chain amino acid transport system substrate-binding protein